MKQIRPDHPYLICFEKDEGEPCPHTDEIFQPDDADWPLYSVKLHMVSAEDSYYGNPGFAFGLSIKHEMRSFWLPADPWNPMPVEVAPVLIELLKKVSL
jgi:hypothetical protein